MYWGILCWYPVILIRLSLCSKQKQKYLSALGNQSENVTYFVTQLDLSSFDGLCNYRASDFLHISWNYKFKMRENLKGKQSFQLLVKDDSSCWLFVLLHLTCLLPSCFSPRRLFLPHFFLQSAGVCSACWQQRKCVLLVVLPTRNVDCSWVEATEEKLAWKLSAWPALCSAHRKSLVNVVNLSSKFNNS